MEMKLKQWSSSKVVDLFEMRLAQLSQDFLIACTINFEGQSPLLRARAWFIIQDYGFRKEH